MAGKNIAKLYASSLVEISHKGNILAQVEEEIQYIHELFSENAELFGFFTARGISKVRKRNIVKNVFGDNLGKFTVNLLNIMIDNDRESEILKLRDEFKEEIDRIKNIQKVTIVSSTELSSQIKDKVINIFKEKLKKDISLQENTDSAILGGIIIKYDDLVIDGSLAKDLKKLKNNLLNSKIGSEVAYED